MGLNGELVMRQTIEFMDEMANRLDGWAQESREGGWSTHQVAANKKAADDCRRQAAAMRQIAPRY